MQWSLEPCCRTCAGGLAAHVVAALTNAGKTIVDPKALDSAIWLYLGDECDNANEPNYEEDNYDAGFIVVSLTLRRRFAPSYPRFWLLLVWRRAVPDAC
ncbi:hypothetical protein GS421_02945 [Rhodococcus hoagii]|nr:hypothetical protein [Prescottella equi]